MAAENLKELFVEELRDMYDAEKQLTKALPKMVKAAENNELRSAFEDHLEITKGHVSRCEEVFKLLGVAARAKPCEGMKGIIKEGDEATGDLEGSTLDAALIASVGTEGVVGFAAITGDTSLKRSFLQITDGYAQYMPLAAFHRELARGGPFSEIVDQFSRVFIDLAMQLAACNRLHSLE